MAKTKTILTSYGNDRILKAIAQGTTVTISSIVYGDSNGIFYEPQLAQTQLVNQLGELTDITKNFNSADGFIYFSSTIPANAPAFVLRELGLLDDKGNLIAVCCTPDVSKPEEEEGLEVSLPISIGFKTSTGEVMVVYVDKGQQYPDKQWVIDQFEEVKIISSTNF